MEDLTKNELSFGGSVGFVDRAGAQQHGRVVRLNHETATIESQRKGWRVSYSLLSKIVGQNMV